MLAWRLTISFFLIPLLIGVFVLDATLGVTSFWLFGLLILLLARSVWEMVSLLRNRLPDISFSLPLICSLSILLVSWVPHLLGSTGWVHSFSLMLVAFALSVLLIFAYRAIGFREPGESISTLGGEIVTVVYVGLLISMTAQLRWVQFEAPYLALGSLVVAVKSGDIGAYTLGRLFGKRKMMPLLSPGKTWMGALGALAGATLGTLCYFKAIAPLMYSQLPELPLLWSVGYGIVLGGVGLMGDLCESLIKRDMQQKDSAALMPGFGGLLDLLDSVLYAGPVAFLLWMTLPG